MDYQPDDQFRSYDRPPVPPRDSMTSVAVALGVTAIATTCCIYASVICGALSIILALLARGERKTLSPPGKMAVTMSAIAIVISIIVTVLMFAVTIIEYGSIQNFMDAYTQIMGSLTGAGI